MAVRCPSCHGAMTPTAFRTHVDTALDIDICWPCHLVWFDHLESAAMSAQSVISLFQQIHDRRSEARRLVSLPGDCPLCASTLQQTSDLSKAGRFQYQRCPHGHGRASTFVQFLREKQFIRTVTPSELRTLSATAKQIRCSSCGAGIDISHDAACSHCGSPVSVLDEQAVSKALAALDVKRMQETAQRNTAKRLETSPIRPSPAPASATSDSAISADLVDLVVTGVAAILSATLD